MRQHTHLRQPSSEGSGTLGLLRTPFPQHPHCVPASGKEIWWWWSPRALHRIIAATRYDWHRIKWQCWANAYILWSTRRPGTHHDRKQHYEGWMKHINICYHNSHNLHIRGIAQYGYVNTDDNLVDLLIRGLPRGKAWEVHEGHGYMVAYKLRLSLCWVLYCIGLADPYQATAALFSSWSVITWGF